MYSGIYVFVCSYSMNVISHKDLRHHLNYLKKMIHALFSCFKYSYLMQIYNVFYEFR